MKNPLIQHKWWKVLTVLFLLYTFTVGLVIPLKPGITNVNLNELILGQSNKVRISTYNTQFTANSALEAYIKLDSSNVLKASNIEVIDRKNIEANFDLPTATPSELPIISPTLIIADKDNGYMILPSAFVIKNTNQPASLTWDDTIQSLDNPWFFRFPYRTVLYETIRNTFFHVAIWMAMFILLIIGLIYSIRYLIRPSMYFDAVSASFTLVAVIFGCIGMVTGSVWAKNAWGAYWTDDPKLNMATVAMIIYAAYLILRSSIPNDEQRAKIAAAYNIFAFVAMIPLIFIIPRLTSSLHPGNGGNPALGGEDLDHTLRLVFYPTIIGFTLMGVWLSSLFYRLRAIDLKLINRDLHAK